LHAVHRDERRPGVGAFPNVPVGRYDLLVNLDGFKPVKRTGLAVDINGRLQVDVALSWASRAKRSPFRERRARGDDHAIARWSRPPR
jgi:hypothetical protein